MNQYCPKRRRLPKLSIDSRDERPNKKIQPKATTSGLTITLAKPSDPQRVETEVGKKVWKKKKRKSHRIRREKANSPILGVNPTPTAGKKKAGQNQDQNRDQNQDLS